MLTDDGSEPASPDFSSRGRFCFFFTGSPTPDELSTRFPLESYDSDLFIFILSHSALVFEIFAFFESSAVEPRKFSLSTSSPNRWDNFSWPSIGSNILVPSRREYRCIFHIKLGKLRSHAKSHTHHLLLLHQFAELSQACLCYPSGRDHCAEGNQSLQIAFVLTLFHHCPNSSNHRRSIATENWFDFSLSFQSSFEKRVNFHTTCWDCSSETSLLFVPFLVVTFSDSLLSVLLILLAANAFNGGENWLFGSLILCNNK